MIHSLIHPGSGLGNQLFRIVAGKVLALDKGCEYSAIGRENFKGKSFMNIDFGPPNKISYRVEMPAGKIVIDDSLEFFDGHIVDDEFQSPLCWGHRLNEVDEWLSVDEIDVEDDVCVIGFRGGEFYAFPELGLPKSYYDEAIDIMKSKGIKNFEVHTDDPILAKQLFPDFKVIHDIGINWRSMRYAKHAIIANSSFYILPRLLKHNDWPGMLTIAPRYWARRNIGEWSRPDNYYKDFIYI